ncbi:cysteine desulfurase [Clostridium acetobutylicum]|uniref:Possible cysteine desulphurase from NifS family n=1 Tax=Clostridium acetobutylicum (strain ATCC 824 / DSM 792 / JCM 1419 / IAM 19013 / LMG 5710 / NBRC 13948 / NRRL B-527 / VKM B-1787 / 2291 / W) TaxID=272562 RepID=Q97EY3_CLOAB|nr:MULTISPECIES: cysteine desulfurase family protein [Clostridium]AAK80914.1 Possible cysteine desulphurase from NifS family [Clostridium acetobutylicum ATCC 824]ADZ22016.1 putative cysteine desulfurase from NifS family [Clostridium acetobutylicum EA 2018]AEI34640.1 NifS family cysteine desulfurase [Clostridium acetobutylicum DSM 1731]AWV78674.1 cysteine desulfurase [Clostridium acetobutylicum]MBC2393537.1 cysteine desulfurase [Clostridium acetobutylicum]
MVVYFDNSATTKPLLEVADIMKEVFYEYYGNPSSLHLFGKRAEDRLIESRKVLAATLGVSPNEIIFTSGGSESNNFLIKGFAKPGNHIITSKIEHPSVLNTCQQLERFGVEVTYLNVDNEGKLNLKELKESIKKNTVLVSIMHVNNEIGVIQDVKKISSIIKERSTRAKFHVDAVQSYGKLKINPKEMGIDLLSVSAHKIYGPRGIGFAYVRKGLMPDPLICGGGQEFNFRSGTENLPAIAAFAYAANDISKKMKDNYKKVSDLKEYFVDKLNNIDGVRINSKVGEDYLPHVLNVSLKGVRGEVFVHALEEKEIYASTGSACSSKKNHKSHVLCALGLDDGEIDGAIRFSFSPENTFEEVDYTVYNIEKILKFLRRLKL